MVVCIRVFVCAFEEFGQVISMVLVGNFCGCTVCACACMYVVRVTAVNIKISIYLRIRISVPLSVFLCCCFFSLHICLTFYCMCGKGSMSIHISAYFISNTQQFSLVLAVTIVICCHLFRYTFRSVVYLFCFVIFLLLLLLLFISRTIVQSYYAHNLQP